MIEPREPRQARRDRRGRLLPAACVLLVVWTIGLVVVQTARDRADPKVRAQAAAAPHSPFRAGALPPGLDGAGAPRFALDDARGGRLSTDELAGRPYAVTFLYADCQDVCPLIGQEIKQALAQLGARGREVTAVAVSAAPETDTPQAVRRWLHRQRMPANFRYALGNRRELTPVWMAHYAGPQPRGKAVSAHSASIWLVDRKGRWRAKFSGGAPVAPEDIAHDLRLLLEEPA